MICRIVWTPQVPHNEGCTILYIKGCFMEINDFVISVDKAWSRERPESPQSETFERRLCAPCPFPLLQSVYSDLAALDRARDRDVGCVGPPLQCVAFSYGATSVAPTNASSCFKSRKWSLNEHNLAMGPDWIRNQEWLCWRGPAAIYWSASPSSLLLCRCSHCPATPSDTSHAKHRSHTKKYDL
jgi:hypothetical protein